MGKHSHKDSNATGSASQPQPGKHSTVEGFKLGASTPVRQANNASDTGNFPDRGH